MDFTFQLPDIVVVVVGVIADSTDYRYLAWPATIGIFPFCLQMQLASLSSTRYLSYPARVVLDFKIVWPFSLRCIIILAVLTLMKGIIVRIVFFFRRVMAAKEICGDVHPLGRMPALDIGLPTAIPAPNFHFFI